MRRGVDVEVGMEACSWDRDFGCQVKKGKGLFAKRLPVICGQRE
jgi:hypothetical protein